MTVCLQYGGGSLWDVASGLSIIYLGQPVDVRSSLFCLLPEKRCSNAVAYT